MIGVQLAFTSGPYPAGMNDLLNTLQGLRPVWPQLLGMSLFACVGIALIAS